MYEYKELNPERTSFSSISFSGSRIFSSNFENNNFSFGFEAMQPRSREMQTLNSILSQQDLQNGQIQAQFDPLPSHDDFLEQMLSSLPSNSWPELSAVAAGINPMFSIGGLKSREYSGEHNYQNFDDQPEMLTSKFQQHQIGESLNIEATAFKLPAVNPSIQSLYNEFTGSLQSQNNPQLFHQSQKFVAPATASGGTVGVTAAAQPPKQRVRARRGQATDPHSIAERLRRERIAERMKALQELVPNANKTDKASMLDEIIDYVKFLQLQVKVLSMSRLGGAAAVAPLVADLSSQGGGDFLQTNDAVNGVQTAASSVNDTLTVTEQQVAKLMEEDMGSAMQYLQGKGLCLMPISLATAISTVNGRSHHQSSLLHLPSGEVGPVSPNMSVLTVQSANTLVNGVTESISKS